MMTLFIVYIEARVLIHFFLKNKDSDVIKGLPH